MIKERALYICDDFDLLIDELPNTLTFKSRKGNIAVINRDVLITHVNEIRKHFEETKWPFMATKN